MDKASMIAAWVLLLALLLAGVIDLLIYITRLPASTVSEHVWTIAREYPLVPLALGILIGHLFWPIIKER